MRHFERNSFAKDIGKHIPEKNKVSRTDRVGSEVRKVLGEFLLSGAFGASAAMASMVIITDVKMSPDLRYAKIFVNSVSPQILPEEYLEFLENQKHKMRAHLGFSMRLRYTPDLRFIVDDSEEKAERIEEILRNLEGLEKSKECDGDAVN